MDFAILSFRDLPYPLIMNRQLVRLQFPLQLFFYSIECKFAVFCFHDESLYYFAQHALFVRNANAGTVFYAIYFEKLLFDLDGTYLFPTNIYQFFFSTDKVDVPVFGFISPIACSEIFTKERFGNRQIEVSMGYMISLNTNLTFLMSIAFVSVFIHHLNVCKR